MGVTTGEPRVLVVDDEPMVREVVSGYLQRDGIAVTQVGDGRSALEALAGQPFDLVVLDIMLPMASGLDVLRAVRRHSTIPVILLTARGDEADRVAGLEAGADDYVVKPFSSRELAARVRGVLRRTRPEAADEARLAPLDFGEMRLDRAAREVRMDGRLVELTPKEFDLLAHLAGHPRQVFSRAELLEQVWESSIDYQDPATVTVHVRRIRQKIESDPDTPRWIATVWGVGYRFEP
ncbi:MAG TPA: response regulator transcription factor [Acidimicrobiales bacterium]|nr:response regulator transcription factor [Acidimicrobiales bacterium]